MSAPLRRHSAARWITTAFALLTITTPFLADWNDTHIYNPRWPPHARFHNAHTMLLGVLLGLTSLWLTWRARANVRLATLIGAIYWTAQAGAILFPGTAFVDPEFADRVPRIAGFQPNQVVIDALFLAVLYVAWSLAPSKEER
jgi:hypothetical protein